MSGIEPAEKNLIRRWRGMLLLLVSLAVVAVVLASHQHSQRIPRPFKSASCNVTGAPCP